MNCTALPQTASSHFFLVFTCLAAGFALTFSSGSFFTCGSALTFSSGFFRPFFHIFHWLCLGLIIGFFGSSFFPLDPIRLAALSTATVFRGLDFGCTGKSKALIQVLRHLFTLWKQGTLARVVHDHMRQRMLQNLDDLVLLQRQSHVRC